MAGSRSGTVTAATAPAYAKGPCAPDRGRSLRSPWLAKKKPRGRWSMRRRTSRLNCRPIQSCSRRAPFAIPQSAQLCWSTVRSITRQACTCCGNQPTLARSGVLTARTRTSHSGNPILGVLAHYCGVDRRRIDLEADGFTIDGVTGVHWRALPVASKPAPYSPNRNRRCLETTWLCCSRIRAQVGSRFMRRGWPRIDGHVWRAMASAACVLVDGTFWTDDEMIRQEVSHKRAREIGHLPQSGVGGMLEWLDRLPSDTRKILIHVNNTNPILDEDSPERAELARHGVEVAWDGMEIVL
mgnify:CR=1 FL=1